MGNGKMYVDDDAMSEEESSNITNEPGLVIRGKGLASQNKIRQEAGLALPNAHFSNLQHSEVTFDNIMGVHSSTRGQTEAGTLGQDILSRQQDFTRLDIITRVLNRGVARLANGLVQLMKMYYTENHVIRILGGEKAVEFIKMHRRNIEDKIEIVVKSGTTLPMDEIALRTEAVQLWQLGAIAPITLYRRLKIPNPEKEVANLMMYKQGMLDMETQAKLKEMQAQAAMGGQAQAQGGSGTKAETPQTAGEGRGTESFLDVVQRAREQLGGKTGTPTKTQASTKK